VIPPINIAGKQWTTPPFLANANTYLARKTVTNQMAASSSRPTV
jgi:hypothetical protein